MVINLRIPFLLSFHWVHPPPPPPTTPCNTCFEELNVNEALTGLTDEQSPSTLIYCSTFWPRHEAYSIE
jgi:hypothetical protein